MEPWNLFRIAFLLDESTFVANYRHQSNVSSVLSDSSTYAQHHLFNWLFDTVHDVLLISQRSRFALAPFAMIDWMNFVLAGDEKGKTRDQLRWNWLFRSMKKASLPAEFFYWNFPQFFTRKVSFFRLFCNFLILLSIYSGARLVAWVVAGTKASGKSCQKYAVQFTKYSCSVHEFFRDERLKEIRFLR